MRTTFLLTPLLLVACSSPRIPASKIVETKISIEQATLLHCKTHNGSITIVGSNASDTIDLRVEMKVRGYTQQEADDNLQLMSLLNQHDGQALRIWGEYPKPQLNNCSPSFTFTMEVPEHLALRLETHNGDVTASGTKDVIHIESHNGDVEASVGNTSADIETHNGKIHVAMKAPGDLNARIVSHNGDIDVRMHAGSSCWLEAETHNGSIDPPSQVNDAKSGRRSLRCRVGKQETKGLLRVESHNGDIRVH